MKRQFLLTASLALALLLTGGAATAIAKPLAHDVQEFSMPFNVQCEGLNVAGEVNFHQRFLVNGRGRDGLAHWQAKRSITDVFTNLDNGRTYTREFNYTFRNHEVTDNGDGTYTVQQREAGRIHHYGPDGERLGVEAGQVLSEWVFAADGPWPSAGTVLDIGPPTLVGNMSLIERPLCEVLHEVIG